MAARVQPNLAFDDARLQSLGYDAWAHTLVWVSMMRQAPALTWPQA